MLVTNLVKKKVFNFNCLHNEDLTVLNEVLRKSNILNNLDLQDNPITLADGIFTDALTNNCILRHPYSGWNKIGSEGTTWLAAALKANQAPQVIWLGYN